MLKSEIRKQKLEKLIEDKNKSVSQIKLYYKGSSQLYYVYKIDPDWLIYNRHNGRLESEMLTYQKEHAIGDDEYNDELHELIDDFLWRTNTGRNRHTLIDLETKGQQRPGIVTLDGVIIDGNRRAMLLQRLGNKLKTKQYFEAVILPDAYDENEAEIVRLETQYQIGEDAKLDYGPLEKYLHVKRLKRFLDIDEDEIAQLMGETEPEIKRLLGIMDLMDEYLEAISCDGLYNMLKDPGSGTKEGMFVDLYNDLKRFEGGSAQVQWAYDEDVDSLDLKTIQFDHIRFGGELSDTNKTYRAISHDGAGKKSFFAHQEIWERFSEEHHKKVDPITSGMGSLDKFCVDHPDFGSRVDAARARNAEWKERVHAPLKANFGISEDALDGKVEEIEPARLLERALNALQRIDVDSAGFSADPKNRERVIEIGQLTFQMKKRLERQ